MPIYRHSTWRSYDEGGVTDSDCVVNIVGPDIIVEFEGDSPHSWYRYTGYEVGPGHYQLECRELNGTATLHRMPDEDILEGRWKEGNFGMWMIELSDVE
ncbi:MAG: hypothetical protein ACTHLT_00615 [Devosia sp.]